MVGSSWCVKGSDTSPPGAQVLTKQDLAAARMIDRRTRKLARLTEALTHWRAKLLSNTRSWEERNRMLRAEKDAVIKHYQASLLPAPLAAPLAGAALAALLPPSPSSRPLSLFSSGLSSGPVQKTSHACLAGVPACRASSLVPAAMPNLPRSSSCSCARCSARLLCATLRARLFRACLRAGYCADTRSLRRRSCAGA